MQHFMELEDVMEQERKAQATTMTRLEGQRRALEGKARSYADQGMRRGRPFRTW